MLSPFQQIKELWSRLPRNGRISVVAAAVATLGLIAALVFYGSQPEYAVLFADLKPADAQSIVEKLKAANVPYSLSNNNTTVSVPAEKVSEMRLQMASSGVLSGGHVGFDLFDKTNFGATDFAQQVNYRRAIEGELARTLEGMDEIESARVHITAQKESIFTEKAEGAKASAVLRVKQNKELSNERTEAIVSLIASSVEGLDPSQVSVMDSRGRLLAAAGRNRAGSFGDIGAFTSQLEAKQKYEAETAARIVSLIEPLAGENRVRADVAADVDFSQTEQTEEKYDPKSQVARNVQNAQQSRNSAQKSPQIAGARANDPTLPAQTAAQQTQQNTDSSVSSTTNYEIDKTVRRTIGGGGQIKRLSVSVVVDYKTTNNVAAARSDDELRKIQDLVGAAVGVDNRRGDQIVVQTMAFDKPQIEDQPKSFADNYGKFAAPLIKYGALVAIAILLLLFVVRPARRALQIAAAPAQIEAKQLAAAETPALPAAEERRETPELSGEIAAEQIAPQLSPMLTVAQLEAAMEEQLVREAATAGSDATRALTIKKLLAEQTAKDPQLIAGTLRNWLRADG